MEESREKVEEGRDNAGHGLRKGEKKNGGGCGSRVIIRVGGA